MKTRNCSKLAMLALCASLAPAAMAQVNGTAPATIFEHIDYVGNSQALVEGMNNGPLALGNDVASSVKVARCWKVTLYEHGRGTGRELALTSDNPNLVNDDFNDIVSNVLVERDPNCDVVPATIFEHIDYVGKSQALVEGMNNGPLALGNDVASSVKVARCWKVTLYEHGPGNGRQLVLTADNPNLVNDNFNDIVSNVLVERDPNCGG
jgi:hypothetical protein